MEIPPLQWQTIFANVKAIAEEKYPNNKRLQDEYVDEFLGINHQRRQQNAQQH